MSISITAVLGKTSADLVLPALPLALDGKSVETYFAVGSKEDIQLSLDDSRLHEVLDPAGPVVAAFHLHKATRELTSNLPYTTGGVRRIAIIFAGSYQCEQSQDVFGVMFDRGYPTDDDRNDSSDITSVPREGCAVFLGTIAAARGAGSPAFETEAAFTTIHELGHVFNLQHVLDPPNFLARSPAGKPYGPEAYHFEQDQIELLRSCSVSDTVCPGGSIFAEQPSEGASSFSLVSSQARPQLRVDMHQAEFWPFEPVELEIWLHAADGTPCPIPNEVDPGYGRFRIWIEDPLGERRFYRSPTHYCGGGKPRRIAPGATFERDVTIFGQSGGYTFRLPGPHRVWATFAAGDHGLLESNVLEVNVLPPAPTRAKYSGLREHLAHPPHSRLLFYRHANPEGRAVRCLADFCESSRFGRLPAAAATSYALGRVFLNASKRTGSRRADDREARERWKAQAIKHLKRAADHRELSPHRRTVAERLVASPGP